MQILGEDLKKYFQYFRPAKSLPLRALLVDDSMITHKALKHRFGVFGWTLASAYDGLQAVKRFESDKFAGIDIVLMDLSMPVMDGRTATHALLKMGCQIPILILTATRRHGPFREVDGVLYKPLQIPILVTELISAYKKNLPRADTCC